MAFPLLQKLAEVGDSKAKRAFKEEVAKRFETGCPAVVLFLIRGGYLNRFTKEELSVLYDSVSLKCLGANGSSTNFSVIVELAELGLHKANLFLENNVERAFKTANFFVINYLLVCNYLETLKKVEKKEFLLKIFQAIEENARLFGREPEALCLVMCLLKKDYLKLLDRKELASIYKRLHLEDVDLKQSLDGYKLDLEDFLSGWKVLKEKLKEHILGLYSGMDLEAI